MNGTELKCDQPGCGYIARHIKPVVAKRMMGIHKSRIHNIKSAAAIAREGKPKKRVRLTPVVVSTQPTREVDSRLVALLDEFQHCPHCGRNIKHYLTAVAAQLRHVV